MGSKQPKDAGRSRLVSMQELLAASKMNAGHVDELARVVQEILTEQDRKVTALRRDMVRWGRALVVTYIALAVAVAARYVLH